MTDHYDVEAMIRDARAEIRGEIDNAVREAINAVQTELTDLRYDISELREQVASALISGGTLG